MTYADMSTIYEREIDNALLSNVMVAEAFANCMPEIEALFTGK